MKKVVYLFILLVPNLLIAQQAAKALEKNDQSLRDRYQIMKTSSQTYEDYKVVKEFVLDGFWKITTDSLKEKETRLVEAKNKINDLQAQVNSSQQQLAQQQASVEGITFDSTHISVLGIHLGKQLFLIITGAVIIGLLLVIVGLAGRVKISQASAKEKIQAADALVQEYDEYKRKALEKQAKLSRELQNERNKLVELRRS